MPGAEEGRRECVTSCEQHRGFLPYSPNDRDEGDSQARTNAERRELVGVFLAAIEAL
jgi:hypothetical protein